MPIINKMKLFHMGKFSHKQIVYQSIIVKCTIEKYAYRSIGHIFLLCKSYNGTRCARGLFGFRTRKMFRPGAGACPHTRGLYFSSIVRLPNFPQDSLLLSQPGVISIISNNKDVIMLSLVLSALLAFMPAPEVQAVITQPNDTLNIAGVTVTRLSGFDSTASSGDTEIIRWLWDWGDGGFSMGPEVYHTFRTVGKQTVTLTVFGDSLNSKSSTTINIDVKAFDGKVYFVSSSTGDDKFPGTAALPFKSIQRALDASAAGRQGRPDAIAFKSGDTWDWDGDLFPNRPSVWINYGAGSLPVINMGDGHSLYLMNGFHSEPANTYGYSVYLNNIWFKWPTSNRANMLNLGTWGSQVVGCRTTGGGMSAAGGPEKITLKKCDINGVDYSGFFSSSSWCGVLSCNIHGNGADPTFHHEIYMSMNQHVLVKDSTIDGRGAKGANYAITFSGTRKFYVADCDIMHTNYGLNLGTNGDDDQREGQDGLIERCAIHDMGEFNQCGAFWFTRMARCVVKNCLVFNCDKYMSQAVIIFVDRKETDNTHDIRILNNTFYSNDTQGIQVGPWVKNISFTNNIVYRDNDQPFVAMDSATLPELHFDYNNYFNTAFGPDDSRAFYASGKKSFNDWKKVQDAHSVWGDPSFIDPANRNFHLAADSAAIDIGLTINSVWEDFARADRLQGGAYEAGAFIY